MSFQQHYLTIVPSLKFDGTQLVLYSDPQAGYPGGRYPEKTFVLEIPGLKEQGVLVRSETKIEVRRAFPEA